MPRPLFQRFMQKLASINPLNMEHRAKIEHPAFSYIKFGYPKNANLIGLREYTLNMPEVYGRLKSIINDIINGYEISCGDEKLKEEIETFLVENNFLQKLESALLDKMIYGDGYLEPVFVSEGDAKKLAETIYSSCASNGLLKKSFDISGKVGNALSVANEAGLFEPSEIWWVDSRYVYKIVDDKGRLLKYVQRVFHGPVTAEWRPNQLIEFSFPKYNSDVYGYTPLMVALNDLATLDVTKTYIKNFFENNGVPDYLIGIENASPESEAFKALVQEMSVRRDTHARGSLITTAKINAVQLNQLKDMDFKLLSKHLGEIIDLLWGIPVQKNSVESSGTRSIDTFMAPYYTNIRKEQRILEGLLDSGFFSLFGKKAGVVKIKFNNPYLRDAVRNVAWATTAWSDGVLSLSEYRAALNLTGATPADLKDNPNYGKEKSKQPKPFKGTYADNNVNKPDVVSKNPKDVIREKDLKEGINWA